MPYARKEDKAKQMREYRSREKRREKFLHEELEINRWFIFESKKLLREYDVKAANANCEHEQLKIWEEEYMKQYSELSRLHDRKLETLKLKYKIKDNEPEKIIKIKV